MSKHKRNICLGGTAACAAIVAVVLLTGGTALADWSSSNLVDFGAVVNVSDVAVESLASHTEKSPSQFYANVTPSPVRLKKQTVDENGETDRSYVTVPPRVKTTRRLNVSGRVLDLSTSTRTDYVFMLDFDIPCRPVVWKIFIQKSRPKPTSLEKIEKRAVKIIEGTGELASVIAWDGRDKNFRVCKGGKYYYSLVIWDTEDQLWRSSWYDFQIR